MFSATKAAKNKALLKKGEPRFERVFSVPTNSPDWLTEGSIPANATNLEGELNLLISPISDKMIAAKVLLIPGIVDK